MTTRGSTDNLNSSRYKMRLQKWPPLQSAPTTNNSKYRLKPSFERHRLFNFLTVEASFGAMKNFWMDANFFFGAGFWRGSEQYDSATSIQGRYSQSIDKCIFFYLKSKIQSVL